MTSGPFFARRALEVLELYAGKLARTVLRGRKLAGTFIEESARLSNKWSFIISRFM